MTEGAAAVVGAAAVAGAAAIAGALALDTVADKSAAVTGTKNPVVPNASTTAEEGTDADAHAAADEEINAATSCLFPLCFRGHLDIHVSGGKLHLPSPVLQPCVRQTLRQPLPTPQAFSSPPWV